MFENDSKMISIHPVFYLKGYNYLLESLTLINYPGKFKSTLNRMIKRTENSEFPDNDNLNTLIFLYKYNNWFNYYNFHALNFISIAEMNYKENSKVESIFITL